MQGESTGVQARSRLEDRAFGYLRIPARSIKPRSVGQTIVADRGLGSHAQADLLEVGADFVDWVKICSTTPRLYTEELLRRKIGAYREADVRIFLTGDGFELGIGQGVMDRVYADAAELGCAGMEVAAAQVILSLDARVRLVRQATGHGLHVFAEVGRKGMSDRRAHAGWLLRQIDALMEAGAYRVLLQGEGIVEDVGEIDESLLLDLAAHVDLESVVFQAKDARAQRWFIENLGPDTNLDVDSHQLITLELARRGLAKRGLVGLVAGEIEGAGEA
ncbi:MAG: phosphosulfolactate synthase [Candidatus Limnocylindria bacterium]